MCFAKTCIFFSKLTFIRFCLQLGFIDTMIFSFWIYPWTYNKEILVENNPICFSLYCFPAWDHLSKRKFSNSSSERFYDFLLSSDLNHLTASSREPSHTKPFLSFSYMNLSLIMISSIVGPSSFPVKISCVARDVFSKIRGWWISSYFLSFLRGILRN